MKNTMKQLFIGLTMAFGLTLAGCTSISSTVDGKTHVFTEQQNCPALLEMDRGQTLELLLNENPSTGFMWSLVAQPKLFKVEEIYQSDQQKIENDQAPMVDVGGKKVYRFTAIQAGEELLHLKHARTWEQAPIDEWTCRVRIS
ncbi:hypothetical protein B9T33_06840 [Acinetobacter sp. ANC 5054]|nr:hypothetical protein B9T33_06840 [Acinetobacter sp. ANC 5054]